MAVLDQLSCEQVLARMGKNRCKGDFLVPRGVIALPKGTIWGATDLANLRATMTAATTNDDQLVRIYPINSIVGITDNSEEAQYFTYPDGSTLEVRDEVYRWQFQHREGFCYHKNLMDLDNSEGQYEYMFYDGKNTILATRVYDDAGVLLGVRGATASMFTVQAMKIGTFSDAPGYMFTVEISDVSQLNQDGSMIQAGFNITSAIPAIQGVELSLVDWVNGGTGVLNVLARTACGGLNMVTEYGNELDVAGAWVVTNTLTGNAITITSVTQTTSGGLPVFQFDLDSADPDYPASAAYLNLALAAPSVLSGLDVEWYESDTISIQRP